MSQELGPIECDRGSVRLRKLGRAGVVRGHGVAKWLLTAALMGGPLVDVAHYVTSARALDLGPFTFGQWVRGALCLALGWILFANRLARPPRAWRLSLPLLLLVVWAAATAPLSFSPFGNLVYAMRVAFLLALLLGVAALWTRRRLGETWMARAGWIILLGVLASQLGGWLTGARYYGFEFELPGMGARPSLPGGWLAAVLPLFLRRDRLRLTDVGAICLVVSGSIGTLRRSAVLAVFLTLIAAAITEGVGILRHRGLLKCLALASLVSFLFVSLTGAASGLSVRVGDAQLWAGGTASGRAVFMKVALTHILSRDALANLFGEGVGSILPVTAQGFGAPVGSHNEWLDVCVSFGVPGVILVAWFHAEVLLLLASLRAGYRRAVLACLITLLTVGGTAGGIFDPTSAPVFVLLGAAAANASVRVPHPRGLRRARGWPLDGKC